VGSYGAKWARVRNSVPPLLMKAIAECIRCRFFMKKSVARYSATLCPARSKLPHLLERNIVGVSLQSAVDCVAGLFYIMVRIMTNRRGGDDENRAISRGQGKTQPINR
jgi:hypothetical protein